MRSRRRGDAGSVCELVEGRRSLGQLFEQADLVGDEQMLGGHEAAGDLKEAVGRHPRCFPGWRHRRASFMVTCVIRIVAMTGRCYLRRSAATLCKNAAAARPSRRSAVHAKWPSRHLA
jgi:hypothetical protein